jgi:hypothetical protein
MADTIAIATIAATYVEQRDNFAKKRNAGGLFSTLYTQSAFVELIKGFAAQVESTLPPMNLAQWEGLAELVNSQLNEVRARGAKK